MDWKFFEFFFLHCDLNKQSVISKIGFKLILKNQQHIFFRHYWTLYKVSSSIICAFVHFILLLFVLLFLLINVKSQSTINNWNDLTKRNAPMNVFAQNEFNDCRLITWGDWFWKWGFSSSSNHFSIFLNYRNWHVVLYFTYELNLKKKGFGVND